MSRSLLHFVETEKYLRVNGAVLKDLVRNTRFMVDDCRHVGFQIPKLRALRNR